MKKGVILAVGGAVVAGLVLALSSKSASAATNTIQPGQDPWSNAVQPKNAQEAYALAMNPQVRDPDYVHKMAQWLASYGQRPDWAAAAEKRSLDLKAESILQNALVRTTTDDMLQDDLRILTPTHPTYAAIVQQRIAVENGATPPAPYTIELLSGGTLAIDMSLFAPKADSGSGSGGSAQNSSPLPSIATTTPISLPTSSPSPATTTQAAPVLTSPSTGVASSPSVAPAATSVALPANATPLAHQELAPENDPYGTLALCRTLLSEQERSNWKQVSSVVRDWQTKVGLTADGKFGTAGALRMAQECVVLPWVRYWPLNGKSKDANVSDFRMKLKTYAQSLAKTKPAIAAQLVIAANREAGQGWPDKPKAAPVAAVTPKEQSAAWQTLGLPEP